MTDLTETLREIRERAEAATEGPWERDQFGPDDDSARFIGSPSTGRIVVFEAATAGNAEFVAHARTDVPRLVEALEAVLGRHTEQYGACMACSDLGGNVPYPCEDLRAITEALTTKEAQQ